MTLLWSVLAAQAGSVRASTTLRNAEGTHPAAHAFDGQLKTGWAEGSEGHGEGQWLELDLGRATQIDSVSIWPGNLMDGARSFREHGRPKVLGVLVDGEPFGGQVSVENEVHRIDVPIGTQGRRVRLVVERAYPGVVFEDLYIAEMAVNFVQGAEAERMTKWQEQKGKASHDRHIANIESAYLKHKAEEFGDRDSFAVIADAAADGAPHVRKAAQAMVPVGFRIQAIPSDDTAREALRKLKDANAIPALQLAALRSSGQRQAEITETMEIFEAYQNMIGGGALNVPQWGHTGFESGAFQSFGEPLAIDSDRWGNILVADTGNNRVQRISDEGRFKKAWGTAQDLTNLWFEGTRPWYASGSAGSEDPGGFVNPLDVVVMPQKGEDHFAVLDARNRIQTFNDAGQLLASWTMTIDSAPRPGLGGEGYLAWIPKKGHLVALVRDEGVTYTAQGEEMARFQITDGTPRAVEVAKNGMILMAFDREIVAYNPDGFRHGKIGATDLLDQGYEELDMTLDQDGRLWILTDTGWVYKFKNPNKLDFKVQVAEYGIENQRIVVRDGFLYYTVDDHIEVVDVLQVKMDAEEAEAAEEEL